LAQVAQEALRAAQDQLQATIQFFLRIPQRVVAQVVVAPVDQPTHQTPAARAVGVMGRAAVAVLPVILQALRHRKATRVAMVMDQTNGKVAVAAAQVRLE
jgi:hypothetical protein